MIHGSTFFDQQMLRLLYKKCEHAVYHVILNVVIGFCFSIPFKLQLVERRQACNRFKILNVF